MNISKAGVEILGSIIFWLKIKAFKYLRRYSTTMKYLSSSQTNKLLWNKKFIQMLEFVGQSDLILPSSTLKKRTPPDKTRGATSQNGDILCQYKKGIPIRCNGTPFLLIKEYRLRSQ